MLQESRSSRSATMIGRDRPSAPGLPFERVVCAIDGSPESIEAAYQGMLIAPGIPAMLVHILDTADAPSRPAEYPSWVHTGRESGNAMLSAARRRLRGLGVVGTVHAAVEEGEIPDVLRYVTASPGRRVLLTLGSGEAKKEVESPVFSSSGVWRVERVVETVDTSVLVARWAEDRAKFPHMVTVGVDGSEPSLYALQVGSAIAERCGAGLTVLTALGGKGLDVEALRDARPRVAIDRLEADHPVGALVHAAAENGLVVVGNRGRHGLRALGSVSSAVVAQSPVSVLVVRRP